MVVRIPLLEDAIITRMKMERKRESLASRLGFLLLSAGCAIGLGNVWRFPFITGKYGGAVFLFAYLFFLAAMGLPIMVMEFALGRASGLNLHGALKALEPKGTRWPQQAPVPHHHPESGRHL